MATEVSDTASQNYSGSGCSLGIPPLWSIADLPALPPDTAQDLPPTPTHFKGSIYLYQAVRS